MNPTHRSHRRAGFTLIELLVVVSIIAVLLAMIMPVLSMTRDAALRLACFSNMHQVGLAYGSYVNDYDGFLPDQNDGSNACYVSTVLMDPYLRRTNSTDKGWVCNGMYRKLQSRGITPNILNGDTVFYYNWNIWMRDMKPFGTSNIGSPSLRMPVTMQRIVYASEAMIFADLDSGSNGGYHRNRANMLMADLSQRTIPDYSFTEGVSSHTWANEPRSVSGNWIHSNPAWVVRGFSVRP